MKCSVCKNRINKNWAWIVRGEDNYHPLCYVTIMAAEIDQLKAEINQLKDERDQLKAELLKKEKEND